MHNKLVISVIIPVFNVEKYLNRCLDSVCSQTFPDFECILVDDGSQDNSPAICDEYCLKDARFRVIHKTQNEGLPKARKTGLDNANSEFVMHLDSDDWLEPDALEILYENQRKNDADIVQANYKMYYDNEIRKSSYKTFSNNNNPLYYFLMNVEGVLHATLYKKYLFDGYIVPEIVIGEDALTNIQLFSRIKSNKLCVINNVIYNYDYRTNNISKIKNEKVYSFEDMKIFIYQLQMEKYLYESGKNSKDVISAFSYFILCGIIPYIKEKKRISRKEADVFNNYWNNFDEKNLFNEWERKIIPIFHKSILLGIIFIYYVKIIQTMNNNSNYIKKYLSKLKKMIYKRITQINAFGL